MKERNLDMGEDSNKLNSKEMESVSGGKKPVLVKVERIKKMNQQEDLHNRTVAMQEKAAKQLEDADKTIRESVKQYHKEIGLD